MTHNPYAADPRYVPPPPHPQKTTILVCGILGIVCCGVAGVVAIVMGRRALREIDEGRYAATDRGTVQAGYICGIIGVSLTALVVLLYVVGGIIAVA